MQAMFVTGMSLGHARCIQIHGKMVRPHNRGSIRLQPRRPGPGSVPSPAAEPAGRETLEVTLGKIRRESCLPRCLKRHFL